MDVFCLVRGVQLGDVSESKRQIAALGGRWME